MSQAQDKTNEQLLKRAGDIALILRRAIRGDVVGGGQNTAVRRDGDAIKSTLSGALTFNFRDGELRRAVERIFLPEAVLIWEKSKSRQGFQATIEQVFSGEVLAAIQAGKFPPLPNEVPPRPKTAKILTLLPPVNRK